jgi:Rieske Fe-S protein
MKRIDFVKKSGAAALLISFGISLNSCKDDSEEIVPDNQDDNENENTISFDLSENPFDVLQTADGWLLHPSENILILNVAGELRAFTSVCTHSGCVDDWTYGSGQFTCNCHGSMFNDQGEVTRGPATGNLKEYTVNVDGNTVKISTS